MVIDPLIVTEKAAKMCNQKYTQYNRKELNENQMEWNKVVMEVMVVKDGSA